MNYFFRYLKKYLIRDLLFTMMKVLLALAASMANQEMLVYAAVPDSEILASYEQPMQTDSCTTYYSYTFAYNLCTGGYCGGGGD